MISKILRGFQQKIRLTAESGQTDFIFLLKKMYLCRKQSRNETIDAIRVGKF